jgi:hypothetical protein
MAVPFADVTDLLNLSATDFEIISGGSPDASSDHKAIKDKNGHFLQSDCRQKKISYTNEYYIKNKAATLPEIGKIGDGGTPEVFYNITSVSAPQPADDHWKMTVKFETYADIPSANQTFTRTDAGLT